MQRIREFMELLNFKITRKRLCELKDKYTDLETILTTSDYELERDNFNSKQIEKIKSFREINKQLFSMSYNSNETQITGKNDVINYIRNIIGYESREIFYLIYLRSDNTVICNEELKDGVLFKGTIDRSVIYPREIMEKIVNYNQLQDDKMSENKLIEFEQRKTLIESCIKNKCKSIVIAHNHPSGSLKPSEADIEVTGNIKQMLSLIGVNLLDHILVSKRGHLSFREEGIGGF